jgi:hypothetical protein
MSGKAIPILGGDGFFIWKMAGGWKAARLEGWQRGLLISITVSWPPGFPADSLPGRILEVFVWL